MKTRHHHQLFDSATRRGFLRDLGLGFGGLALGTMLAQDLLPISSQAKADEHLGWRPPDGRPHFAPKAKSVIWMFMIGGVSQVESFDPKPELDRHDGKTIAETPHASILESPYVKKNVRELVAGLHPVQPKIMRMQVGYRRHGQSGLAISDWWPHLSRHIDDLAIVRSMWTTDNDHGAQLQFHTGRHVLEGRLPTIGSWVHYGLGTMNENLPKYVVLGTPLADCCGGIGGQGSGYLGPEHEGVQLKVDPREPIPYASPAKPVPDDLQRRKFALIDRLDRLVAQDHPDDPAITARIQSYELAFRMQMAVPEALDFKHESEETTQLYGLHQDATRDFGAQCLAARRLVERGVRFVQLFHGSNGGAGAWDAHGGLKANHAQQCAQVDQPIAALLTDLKRRGLLEETLVVWATEFGRTPGSQGTDGRDHHPYGFSVWMAGGGLKGGVAHGETDELGFHAVENRHYVTDIHATVLHALGLDSRRLEVPGHRRLDIDHGQPILELFA